MEISKKKKKKKKKNGLYRLTFALSFTPTGNGH